MDTKKLLKDVSISEFYAGRNIFITGATGFMGKVLVEKLLRDCGQVRCIYILVRMKRGVDPFQRHQNYVQDVIFDRIRADRPEQLKKIRLIKGDISHEKLDIDDNDESELIDNINIIFHCAAKAKFSLELREALIFNTCGTLRVLQLAEKVKNLLVFHHISTSYCCPNNQVLEERYYPAPCDPYELIKLLKSSRAEDLDEIAPRLMKGFPNTYALSKIFSEDLVYSFREKFPIVVTRPSIVSSAINEPYPGYIESKKNGYVGVMIARGRGVLRTMLCDPEKPLEIMPVDIANNAILALTVKRNLTEGNEILYCNLTNSGICPWTLKQYFDVEMENLRELPLDLLVWYPHCPLTTNKLWFQIRRIFLHYLPSIFGDFWCWIYGQKRLLLLHQRKLDTGMHTFGFYNTRKYFYVNENLKSLPMEMNDRDRETFNCDFSKTDMKKFIKDFVVGVRKFICKLHDEDSLQCRKGILELFWYINILATIVFSILFLLIAFIILMLVFDRDYITTLFVDIFYSAKFLISNNLVIRQSVIQRCNNV